MSIHTNQIRLMKNFTPPLYLSTTALKPVLNFLRKRAEKLSISFPFSSMYGLSRIALSAGAKVKEFKAEIPTDTAMVIPNWV